MDGTTSKLTEIKRLPGPKSLYRCECGVEKVIYRTNVVQGLTRSCGCHRRKSSKVRFTIHGYAKSRTYISWLAMNSRVNNQNAVQFKHYGGRGVTVDPRWSKFENFLEDMGERPDDCSLDRKDNDKAYSKENCRWATADQQANNKRSSRNLTFEGRTQTSAQWAAEIGLSKSALHSRLKSGWSVERALTEPVR
jgi:hypothetical protein